MMIRPIMKTTAAAAGLAVLMAQSALGAGYAQTMITAPHRSAPIALHIYYPEDGTSGTKTQLGKNAVFKGTPVSLDASIAHGSHPIVLLSHGSGGNAVNLAWIASHIADQGYLVLAPNHPGTTSGDSTPQNTVKIWERPADMSAILSHTASGALDAYSPDMSSVTAMGFSLGAHTALALAGARVNKAAYISYCDDNVGKWDCEWLAAGGASIIDIDKMQYEADMSDARITRTVAIDPALSAAYTDESLSSIRTPVHLMNLGEFDQIPAAIDARPVGRRIQGATLQDLPNAWHFSFLGECTRMGGMIVKASGEDDPICEERAGGKRAELHAQMKALLTGYFAKMTVTNIQ